MIQIVGDRPDDLLAALAVHGATRGWPLIVTSGGLGPTADDLTAEIVGRFSGREMVLDARLEQRIAEILRPMMRRWPGLDPDAIRASNRKQAVIPAGGDGARSGGNRAGARRLRRPIGDGPDGGRAPRAPARASADVGDGARDRRVPAAIAGATELPARDHAPVRDPRVRDREHAARGRGGRAALSSQLEITTCLRRGEIEIATLFEPPAAGRVRGARRVHRRAATRDTLFSRDGIDRRRAGRVAAGGRTVAVAESCTGGLMSARLTDRAGSSAYFAGGIVAYSNEAKVELVGVDPALIERFGRGLDARSRRRSLTVRSRGSTPTLGVGHHRDRRARRRHRGEAGGAGLLLGRARRTGAHHAARCGSPAAGPTSATARRRSRCTASPAAASGSEADGPLRSGPGAPAAATARER